MGKRELVALLNLSSWCLVVVGRLFLAVPRGLSAVCDCGISRSYSLTFFGSFVIFQGIRTNIDLKPNIFVIFREVVWIPCPPMTLSIPKARQLAALDVGSMTTPIIRDICCNLFLYF